jgi:hypothetical protein
MGPIFYRARFMTQSTRAATTRLSADQRKAIAIQGLAKAVPISTLAVHHNVSRPLVYRQLRQASAALDDVVSLAQTDDTGEVLFMLPVAQRWLDQVILALTFRFAPPSNSCVTCRRTDQPGHHSHCSPADRPTGHRHQRRHRSLTHPHRPA